MGPQVSPVSWKECVGCGEPTLLSLYCRECFVVNFKVPDPVEQFKKSHQRYVHRLAALAKIRQDLAKK
jgi:hypothetical protein